jgi:hypothetical protein
MADLTDTRDHQYLARVDKIEDRFELRSPIQAGAALLLGPDHATPGRLQRGNLRIEVRAYPILA